jgi:hypothetical protein
MILDGKTQNNHVEGNPRQNPPIRRILDTDKAGNIGTDNDKRRLGYSGERIEGSETHSV